jgi:hypothetical protein
VLERGPRASSRRLDVSTHTPARSPAHSEPLDTRDSRLETHSVIAMRRTRFTGQKHDNKRTFSPPSAARSSSRPLRVSAWTRCSCRGASGAEHRELSPTQRAKSREIRVSEVQFRDSDRVRTTAARRHGPGPRDRQAGGGPRGGAGDDDIYAGHFASTGVREKASACLDGNTPLRAGSAPLCHVQAHVKGQVGIDAIRYTACVSHGDTVMVTHLMVTRSCGPVPHRHSCLARNLTLTRPGSPAEHGQAP